MAINKAMRTALRALSYMEPDVQVSYKIERALADIPAKIRVRASRYHTWDHVVQSGDHSVPVRIFSAPEKNIGKTLLFFHGGGWVTGNIDTYENVCVNMAKIIGATVVSVDYSLAPEHRFPIGLEDCYAAARELFESDMPDTEPENIVIVGDSAGGNLAAAVSLLAKERGEFMPQNQILIYPSTYNDHSESSPYKSVVENGTDYLLTSRRVSEYMNLYRASDADRENPLYAPLLAKDLRGQPRTLVISAEFCPLRDEGEAYGRALRDAGGEAEIYRMRDALHGFFSLPLRYVHVRRALDLMRRFLEEDPA